MEDPEEKAAFDDIQRDISKLSEDYKEKPLLGALEQDIIPIYGKKIKHLKI